MKYKYWQVEDYDDTRKYYNNKEKRKESSSVECECGSNDFLVNALPAPYTGGFIKITCSKCGKSDELIDDFS